jgi:uncharacterized protein YjiS (DUF1127 family)
MAYLLSGERPAVSGSPNNPFVGVRAWIKRIRAAHARRVALNSLLEFEEHRLDDLGISRSEVVEALRR